MSAILGKGRVGKGLTGAQYVAKAVEESTLRFLCVLCASAVKENEIHLNRRGAEGAEETQRNAID